MVNNNSTKSVTQVARVMQLNEQFLWMEWTDSCGIVPNAINVLTSFVNCIFVSDIPNNILNSFMSPKVLVGRHNVEGNDTLCTSFHKHFHKALSNKPSAASHQTYSGWAIILLSKCCLVLQRAVERRKHRICHCVCGKVVVVWGGNGTVTQP